MRAEVIALTAAVIVALVRELLHILDVRRRQRGEKRTRATDPPPVDG